MIDEELGLKQFMDDENLLLASWEVKLLDD